MFWMCMEKRCSLKCEPEYFEISWLNGHLKPEKKWVRQDSLQGMRMWCPTTGKSSRQSTSAGAVCHVGTKVWLSLNLGSLAFDPKQSQTLSPKLFILLQRRQLGKYWQWQVTRGIRDCTHGNLLVTGKGKAIFEYLLKLDWIHNSFLFISPSGCFPSIFVS